jgi:hypothetical protein
MENPERDTQFQNFARLLAEEIRNASPEETEKIIARRAHDLVEHAFEHCDCREWGIFNEYPTPDMTVWPSQD